MGDANPVPSSDKSKPVGLVAPAVRILVAIGVGALLIYLLWRPFGWGIAAVLLWIVLGTLPGMIRGMDGNWSTSKFQLFLWTGSIAYCLVTFFAYRLWVGPSGTPPTLPVFPDMPTWMWVALGLSVSTSLAAKGITFGYVASQRLQPSTKEDKPKLGWLGLIADDSGVPEITKIQMLFWTILAVIYVFYDSSASLWPVVSEHMKDPLAAAPKLPNLPDLPVWAMVLTGLGQGVYVGDKLFDSEQPRLTGLDKSSAKVGETVTIYGTNLGDKLEEITIKLDDTAVTPAKLVADGKGVQLVIPDRPVGEPWPAVGKTVKACVLVRGAPCANTLDLTVMPKA